MEIVENEKRQKEKIAFANKVMEAGKKLMDLSTKIILDKDLGTLNFEMVQIDLNSLDVYFSVKVNETN